MGEQIKQVTGVARKVGKLSPGGFISEKIFERVGEPVENFTDGVGRDDAKLIKAQEEGSLRRTAILKRKSLLR
jgi:hypothetical protein